MIPERLLLIVNPTAGAGKSLDFKEQFYAGNVALRDKMRIFGTRQAKDYTGIRKAFQESKPDVLVVIGGDGTLNDVLNALGPIHIPIHIIPGGSGNDFYQVLGGESDYRIPDWKRTQIVESDLWECNGKYFHNGVGIGFDGSVALHTQYSRFPFLPLRLKYWAAILRKIFSYRGSNCTIESADFNYNGPAFMISIANGAQYGGGFKVAPNALPADGLLDVVIIRTVSVLQRMLHLTKVTKGQHLGLPFVEHVQLSEMTISFPKNVTAHMDGEIFEDSEFRFRKKGVLKVLVPTEL